MRRVYIACFGSGLGHATRMLEIADLLRRNGDVVRFSSSGEVADYIQARGYDCNRLPLADVRYAEDGGMSLRATMAGSPQILARTYRQLYLELGNLKRFQPDIVLSDSSLSSVFAARTMKVKVYTILNQLNLAAPNAAGGAGTSLLSGGTSAGVGKIWEMSDAILIPDLPPPNTISESSLWGRNSKKVRYIGFLLGSERTQRDTAAVAFAADLHPRVFWQVSGPPQTRTPLVKAAEAIASALSGTYAFVLAEGNPQGGRSPIPFKGGWKYGWCDLPQTYLSACDVLVSRAGHGSIARAIASSKPSLLIPIPNQTEQEGNAAKATKLGVSISMRQENLSVESFKRAVETLRRDPYVSRAKSLGKTAASFDARRMIIDLIEGNARRAKEAARGPMP